MSKRQSLLQKRSCAEKNEFKTGGTMEFTRKLQLVTSYRGRIFSHVRPFCELAVSDPDRSMHISLWV
jgi:hypothetical protein